MILTAQLGLPRANSSKSSMLWKQSSKVQFVWAWDPLTMSYFVVWRDCRHNWQDINKKCSKWMTILEWQCLGWPQMHEFFASTWEMNASTINWLMDLINHWIVSFSKLLRVPFNLSHRISKKKPKQLPRDHMELDCSSQELTAMDHTYFKLAQAETTTSTK